jgi:hypothetical protein
MVRPVRFAFNAETAATNSFQVAPAGADPENLHRRATFEFEALAAALRASGVRVVVVDGDVRAPDSVFPNNWVSFHRDGTVVLYPMLATNRRLEVRPDIIEHLEGLGLVKVRRCIDLRHYEEQGLFLEGTGSLVLDRRERVAYACLSPRTSRTVVDDWAAQLGYEPVLFHAVDRDGNDVYHTNVLMGIGTRFAVICPEAIRDPDERSRALERLRSTGRRVLEIDLDQMHHFAGNLIEVRGEAGRPVVVISALACGSLGQDQRALLEECGRVVATDLSVIEALGGGSARCMIAEAAW